MKDRNPPYFCEPLDVEKVREASDDGRALWKLLSPLCFQSKSMGRFTAPVGFVTDFASVPRLPLTYAVAGDTAHASAVIHDYLCRAYYPTRRLQWSQCAAIFYECMKAERVPRWRAWLMYKAVLWFGEVR
jgi:hypothetical protein